MKKATNISHKTLVRNNKRNDDSEKQKKIDSILDKISNSGYELSDEEKYSKQLWKD